MTCLTHIQHPTTCDTDTTIQSAQSPAAVHARIEAFLVAFREVLCDMDDAAFADYADSLISKKLERDRNLQMLAGRLFHEIVSHTYCWNRRELQVEELRATRKQMLVRLFDDFVAKVATRGATSGSGVEVADAGANGRRLLTNWVVGKAAMEAGQVNSFPCEV
jgi:secreted Zn-dependent insulinase-like peptidase